MKCFYHKSDFDGICSATIVKYKYPECEMIGVDYNDWEKVLKDTVILLCEYIFIVDFSFSKKHMESLNEGTNLVWIDHHKTAIDACKDLDIEGKREIGKSGCELTWEYLFPNLKIPLAVKLLGRYDIWDNVDKNFWETEILPFQYGMKLENLSIDNNMWPILLDNLIAAQDYICSIIQQGIHCLIYQQQQDEKHCQNAFEIEFEGLMAICLNTQNHNSSTFASIYDDNKHDIMICFSHLKENWKVSLYSTKDSIDVSEISKKYGGGGHKGASGFIIDDINIIIK